MMTEMYDPEVLLSMFVLVPLAPVVAVLGMARLWRSQERRILLLFCGAALILFAVGGFALFGWIAGGGSDITVTIANESAWPIDVSAINVSRTTIEAGETREFRQWADLGLSGLIDELEMYGGPHGATRIYVEGITTKENPVIRVSGPMP